MQLHLAHREKLAFPFLWNSKPEALKITSLLNTFADGGLNIIDIITKIESLFVKQVLQLIKEHNARWTFLAMYWLVYSTIHNIVCGSAPPLYPWCWFTSG